MEDFAEVIVVEPVASQKVEALLHDDLEGSLVQLVVVLGIIGLVEVMDLFLDN